MSASPEDRFQRTRLLLGDAAFARLQSGRVTVVGLGAVGSHAVEALARAGVGALRLVDFDEVRASNINRQLFALESTVGRFKADVALARVLDINPACRAEANRLLATGVRRIHAPSAAVLPRTPSGFRTDGGLRPGPPLHEETVVLFGPRPDVTGWYACAEGRPHTTLLGRVRHFS